VFYVRDIGICSQSTIMYLVVCDNLVRFSDYLECVYHVTALDKHNHWQEKGRNWP
jgi:hypothetical protein